MRREGNQKNLVTNSKAKNGRRSCDGKRSSRQNGEPRGQRAVPREPPSRPRNRKVLRTLALVVLLVIAGVSAQANDGSPKNGRPMRLPPPLAFNLPKISKCRTSAVK